MKQKVPVALNPHIKPCPKNHNGVHSWHPITKICRNCGFDYKKVLAAIEDIKNKLEGKGDFQVQNSLVQGILKDLGQDINKRLPEGMGFALLLFDFGQGGSLFYIGKGDRSDIIDTMKEFIEKNAKGGD